MNKEFFDAIDLLVKEKGISRETLMEGIKAALLKSCEQFYGSSENIVIEEDEENRQFRLYRELEVVPQIEEGKENFQVLPDKAVLMDPKATIGSFVREELDPQNFSRIAAQNGKSIILQKIREEERQTVSDYF
jgi:N utilization substance protein A